MEEEETCGQELARDAEVPDKLGRLMAHVAENLASHAHWVGTASTEAKREHAALLEVKDAYQAIGEAALRAARAMRAMKDLPRAPHDPSKVDRRAWTAWMLQKIALQRELATMLLEHAEASEKVLRSA